MSAFSWGLTSFLHQHTLRLPSTVRTAICNARPLHIQSHGPTRNFCSSRVLRNYQYPGPRSARPRTTQSLIQTDPVLRTVTQTGQPVLLYRQPPPLRYAVRVYGVVAVCMGIGVFNLVWASSLPEEQPFFVPPTYVVIGIGFIGIGIWIFQRPFNRISTMEVIPSGRRPQLRIRARPAPFMGERVITSDIFAATISEKTAPMRAELMEAERARTQRISEGLEHMFIVARIWEVAARWLHQKWWSFFNSFKFAVDNFGIANIEVDGEKWRLDCSGWLLEEGKAIDRIISEE